MRKLTLLGALVLLALAALGIASATVGRPPEAVEPQHVAVDANRATEIANGAFAAFDVGDYVGWSRDWSDAMRSAIPEEAFQGWRSSVLEQLGRYVSLGTPVLTSRQPGTYRWSFPVTFERGTATIGFGFTESGDEVEGVFVE